LLSFWRKSYTIAEKRSGDCFTLLYFTYLHSAIRKALRNKEKNAGFAKRRRRKVHPFGRRKAWHAFFPSVGGFKFLATPYFSFLFTLFLTVGNLAYRR